MERAFPNISVCVDGRMLGPGGTGVSTYGNAVLSALALRGTHAMVLRGGGARGSALRRLGRLARAVRSGPAAALPANGDLVAPDLFRTAQIHFNARRRLLPVRCAGPPGIMHWTYPVPLRMEGWANVYTVHDLIPIEQPELSPIDPRRHAALLRTIAASAAGIVTVSADAGRRIAGFLGAGEGFVIDCGQGIGIGPVAEAPPAGLTAGGYLLFCGSIEPRKNLERLVQAHRASGTALPLVVAGPDGWRAAEIRGRIDATAGIVWLPYQPRAALIALIAHARALLFPSLAEGFGLPVAEAMTLGTPVMASDLAAIAETAQDAALLVPPGDTRAMAGAIAALARDDALCAMLAGRGRDRAKAFTLDRFGTRLTARYRDLLARSWPAPYPDGLAA